MATTYMAGHMPLQHVRVSERLIIMACTADLPTLWRERAAFLDRYGAGASAQTCRELADELESSLHAHENETLTLGEAADESGYSTDRLRHMIADGSLPQAGKRGAPRVRRGDLPRKQRTAPAFDAAAVAQRMLGGAR